jgi:hypothetical protein
VASGPTSWKRFASWNPDTSTWKTSKLCAGADEDCTEYSATWPRTGMTRDGHAYVPATSARPTAERGSSSSPSLLPTPQARDSDRGGSDPARRRAAGRQVNLTDLITVWPAPATCTSDTNACTTPQERQDEQLLPTPTAATYGSNRSPSPGATRRPSLNTLASTGAFMPNPSATGNACSDGPHPCPTSVDSGDAPA